ncbi:MAG: hypothetical protein IT291_11445 [Deltaproteobacteria bacterium]|nr:hypothetical protein [Deltaproteobacteria bacterium]
MQFRLKFAVSLLLAIIFFSNSYLASAEEVCIYRNEKGETFSSPSKRQIPHKYRRNATCGDKAKFNTLAAPTEIELEGSTRNVTIPSSLGSIEARWPRSAEKFFRMSPNKALATAANATAKAINQAGFRRRMQNTDLSWKVVFLDANMPETQIPFYLLQNCHPGWMTPPANIYIVAQRVARGCAGEQASDDSLHDKSVADSGLAETVVHEMGHVVEHQLLSSNSPDRLRSEGFATWFEIYAARLHGSLDRTSIEMRTNELASISIKSTPNNFYFQGSGSDYSRAAMYFLAVEKQGGAIAIANLYDVMNERKIDLFAAIHNTLHWNRTRLEAEVKSLL